MQIRIVSRLRFCRRSWGLKINISWTLVYFGKSNICTNKLNVQETDFSFTQFYRSWNHFSRCRFAHGWNTSSWSLGFGYRSISLFSKPIKENQGSSTRKLVAWHHIKQAHPKPKKNWRSNQTQQSWVELIMFRRTRSLLYLVRCSTLKNAAVIQMIIKGRSPFSSTCTALRIPAWLAAPKRWRRGCSRNRREKNEVWQNPNLQRWTSLQLFWQVPHPRKIWLHPEIRWNSWLQGNRQAGWEKIQSPT